MTSPTAQVWLRRLRIVYVWLAVLAMAWALLSQDEGRSMVMALGGHPVTWLFVLAWFLMPLIFAAAWRMQLASIHGQLVAWPHVIHVQALAWMGRYLPGKVGLLAGKMLLLTREKIAWKVIARSVLIEQMLFIATGAMVAIILVPTDLVAVVLGGIWEPFSNLWLNHNGLLRASMLLLLAVSTPVCIAWLAGASEAQGKRSRLSSWSLIAAAHVIIHLLLGVALFPLTYSLFPELATTLGIAGLTGILALANVIGILVFVVPAGLLVREGVLVAFFAVHISLADAIAFAAALRFLTMAADLAFVAIGWTAGRGSMRDPADPYRDRSAQ